MCAKATCCVSTKLRKFCRNLPASLHSCYLRLGENHHMPICPCDVLAHLIYQASCPWQLASKTLKCQGRQKAAATLRSVYRVQRRWPRQGAWVRVLLRLGSVQIFGSQHELTGGAEPTYCAEPTCWSAATCLRLFKLRVAALATTFRSPVCRCTDCLVSLVRVHTSNGWFADAVSLKSNAL